MFILPDLPYAYDALAPTMSAETLHVHHDKHHATYVKTLNSLIENSPQGHTNLEDVIRSSAGGDNAKLFNNAAQAWNHAFFWASMSPQRQQPQGELADAIKSTFGDLAALKDAFVKAGAEHFGSGWVWLVAKGGKTLEVISTHDAHDTVTEPDVTPLLVCDLWEHAYYLDYKNDRKAFLEAWFDALPNWRLAQSQLAAASGGGETWRYAASSQSARAA